MNFYCLKISLSIKNILNIIEIITRVYRQFYISSFGSTTKQYPDNASSLVLT